MQPVPFSRVRLAGFWGARQQLNAGVTIPAIYEQMRAAGYLRALSLEWQPGMPQPPHFFWDSDLAKWIEAAAYTLATHPDPQRSRLIDEVIALLARAQQPDGYLNLYYTLVEPGGRWTNLRDRHELYCAGHLMEAAVAHFEATGKHSLLDLMLRYADAIDAHFGPRPGQAPGYPGHEEIELALVRLYRATGERRYLELSRFFVDERGRRPHYFDREALARGEDPAAFVYGADYTYCQAHRPLREQREVTGHAVRAMYVYSAMADLAVETGDSSLLEACHALFESAVGRHMYVTGGIGTSEHNEGFTAGYDLPNDTAYAESCAAIGLFFWMHRMLQAGLDGRYADVMERCLYNGILSGISLDGSRFFQANPLAVDRRHQVPGRPPLHRREWYVVACCPPNISRLIAGLGGYTASESETEVAVHLYGEGRTDLHVAGQRVALIQETEYPWQGQIRFTLEMPAEAEFALLLRIPGWCTGYSLLVNGSSFAAPVEKGYARLQRRWRGGDQVVLDLAMPAVCVYAHPSVTADQGRVALQRGPIVYCLESADTGRPVEAVFLPREAALETVRLDELGGIVALQGDALAVQGAADEGAAAYSSTPPRLEPVLIRAIPYYAWDNRAAGDMAVWIHEA